MALEVHRCELSGRPSLYVTETPEIRTYCGWHGPWAHSYPLVVDPEAIEDETPDAWDWWMAWF